MVAARIAPVPFSSFTPKHGESFFRIRVVRDGDGSGDEEVIFDEVFVWTEENEALVCPQAATRLWEILHSGDYGEVIAPETPASVLPRVVTTRHLFEISALMIYRRFEPDESYTVRGRVYLEKTPGNWQALLVTPSTFP